MLCEWSSVDTCCSVDESFRAGSVDGCSEAGACEVWSVGSESELDGRLGLEGDVVTVEVRLKVLVAWIGDECSVSSSESVCIDSSLGGAVRSEWSWDVQGNMGC